MFFLANIIDVSVWIDFSHKELGEHKKTRWFGKVLSPAPWMRVHL